MIRLKNSILPVWFQWDGDEASLEAAKQTIIDDIKNAGLTHYTTYVDIMDQPGDDDKDWDGISEDVDKESKSRSKANSKAKTTNSDNTTKELETPTDDQIEHKSVSELQTQAYLKNNKAEIVEAVEADVHPSDIGKTGHQSKDTVAKSRSTTKKYKKKSKKTNTGLPKGNTPNMDKFAVSEDETTKTAS